MRHVLAAQSLAGPSAFARCWAHLALANEWALDGEGHGALLELDCAASDADRALSSPVAAPVDDVSGWISGGRGAVLRRLGRWADAEVALRGASSRGPVSDVYLAVEWARLRAATGDVEEAAGHLIAALDACHGLAVAGRLPFIAAAARDLPDCAASRQLADRLRR
jgi:phage tail protein X